MNARNVDELLREWADLGEEHLPERYLQAALDEIETTPQRGAWWAPLEGLLMRLRPAAPLLGIAAVVIAAVAFYAAIFQSNVGDPTPSTEPTFVSGSYATSSFSNPFSVSLEGAASPDGWSVIDEPTIVRLSPDPGSGYEVAILERSGSSLVTADGAVPMPDDLAGALDTLAGLAAAGISRTDVAEPFELTIAGSPVRVIEISVSGGSVPADVFRTADGSAVQRPLASETWWLFDAAHVDLLIVYQGTDDPSRWFGGVAVMLESLEIGGQPSGRADGSPFPAGLGAQRQPGGVFRAS